MITRASKKERKYTKMVKSVYCSIQKWHNLGMKLYHGSKLIIDNPLPFASSKDNDYGPAFYLTADLNSAFEWASRNNSIGYVNEYELDTKNLKILDLTDKNQYSVLNWLALLMHFRFLDQSFNKAFKARLEYIEKYFYIDIRQFDLVIGYRADDAYFRFPLDFIRGNLTLEQLEHSFQLVNLGIQYVLISNKAFSQLKYVKSFLSREEHIGKYFDNVRNATQSFDLLSKDEEGTRIIDLMRELK